MMSSKLKVQMDMSHLRERVHARNTHPRRATPSVYIASFFFLAIKKASWRRSFEGGAHGPAERIKRMQRYFSCANVTHRKTGIHHRQSDDGDGSGNPWARPVRWEREVG